MNRALADLTCADLRMMAADARTGLLSRPYSSVQLGRRLGPSRAEAATAELESLDFEPPLLAAVLTLLAREREAAETHAGRVELVWTGPELSGSMTRDTAVVVPGLFAGAESSVLVSGFAVYQGREVFEPLARRMAERPSLKVKLFLNVARPSGCDDPEHLVVREYVELFRQRDWPGESLPEIYYDPRALVLGVERAVLHAKCIVVDDRRAFVTSANLTTAAQERNIEAGVLVEDAGLAQSLRRQFESLVGAGILQPAFRHGLP